MEIEEVKQKWEGKVSATVRSASADQIWGLVKDFFNLHKWFPTLATCYGVHGSNSEPGCIRYCAGSSIPSDDPHRRTSWSTERLLAIDYVDRTLAYEIVDSNIGFKSYNSTMKVTPVVEDGKEGCLIEWQFSLDPVKGWVLQDLVAKYELGLQRMAAKMEEYFANSLHPQ